MSDIANRYRRVAATFTERVRAVPQDAWEWPAPCEGWVARDVVRHLVEWVPAFVREAGGPAFPVGCGQYGQRVPVPDDADEGQVPGVHEHVAQHERQ